MIASAEFAPRPALRLAQRELLTCQTCRPENLIKSEFVLYGRTHTYILILAENRKYITCIQHLQAADDAIHSSGTWSLVITRGGLADSVAMRVGFASNPFLSWLNKDPWRRLDGYGGSR